MPELVLLIGNIGSGKTTYCQTKLPHYTHISQDEQGKSNHRKLFEDAISRNENIIIDRQGHIREQRKYYLDLAKQHDYHTKIIWLKVDKSLCERRVLARKDHPTVSLKDNIRGIINQHIKSLQGPTRDEADEIVEYTEPYYAPIQDLTTLKGKIAVVGDPHGVWTELEQALNEIKPDHVVYVGDLIDRGPHIEKVLDHARKNYTVRGNHEDKLARALIGNKVSMGGGLDATMAQIDHYTSEQKEELYNWIQSLPLIIKLPKNYAVVHAGLNPERSLEKQYFDTCIYIRNYGEGGKARYDDKKYPKWYEHPLCEDLKKYKILFGHAIHEVCNVAPNIFALDKGAVYGTGLRIMVIDTEGEDVVVEVPTQSYYAPTIDVDSTKVYKVFVAPWY
jgi:protein phosphatase